MVDAATLALEPDETLAVAGDALGMCMSLAVAGPHAPSHLLAGYEDGSVVLWDTAGGGRQLGRHKPLAEPLLALAATAPASKTGAAVVCAGAETTVAALALGDASPAPLLDRVLWKHTLKRKGVNCICVRPDNKLLATAGWDGLVRVFTRKRGRPLAHLDLHREQVLYVCFSPPGPLPELGTGFLLAAASKVGLKRDTCPAYLPSLPSHPFRCICDRTGASACGPFTTTGRIHNR